MPVHRAAPRRAPARPARARAIEPAAQAALERIWAVVAALPPGRVSSYGEVAVSAGLPGRARLVGRALKLAPRSLALPWHRVLTASGRPAFPEGSADYRKQRRLLEREGVRFVGGRVRREQPSTRAALDALLWDVGG
jgi:methylated-DNA-protein-cysteine methyltransferase-like protein